MIKLTVEEIQKREELVTKFQNNTITRLEAEQLKGLLEKEKQEASEVGNFLVFLGIVFLLGLVIQFLSGEDKKRKKTKRFIYI